MRQALLIFVCFVFFPFLFGCSTAPRRPLEIRDLRNSAATQLELLNHEADRGNYAAAYEMMVQCRPLALATDDLELLVKTGVSLGNILFYLGRVEESDRALEEARLYAEESGDAELRAIVNIYLERQRLLKAQGSGVLAAQVRDRVQEELRAVKTDDLALALAWTVAGLAEKALDRCAEAEAAFVKAIGIYEQGRYLEQCAYGWYLVASARSRAGRYADALAALDQALSFDRRAENSHGLGSDWLARGEIYTRMGSAASAVRAFRRARTIFAAAGADAAARDAEARALAAERGSQGSTN